MFRIIIKRIILPGHEALFYFLSFYFFIFSPSVVCSWVTLDFKVEVSFCFYLSCSTLVTFPVIQGSVNERTVRNLDSEEQVSHCHGFRNPDEHTRGSDLPHLPGASDRTPEP